MTVNLLRFTAVFDIPEIFPIHIAWYGNQQMAKVSTSTVHITVTLFRFWLELEDKALFLLELEDEILSFLLSEAILKDGLLSLSPL